MTQLPSVVFRHRDAGVTLIEMLVSLVIFAIVGVASFAMINTLIQVRDRTEGRLETLAQLDRAQSVFARDFMQGDPTSLRLENRQLSILATTDQRHTYDDTNGTMTRTITSEVDAFEPLVQELVRDIQGVSFNVLTSTDIWQQDWPLDDPDVRPRAVRVTISLDEDREITRLVALTDWAGP